jgi:hypothetical protein
MFSVVRFSMSKHERNKISRLAAKRRTSKRTSVYVAGAAILLAAVAVALNAKSCFYGRRDAEQPPEAAVMEHNKALYNTVWLQRAMLIDAMFRKVYSAGWEGANGAIGDAYLFAATGDSSLLRFHTVQHDMRLLFKGTWVDDQAWNCLAELYWWDVTGRKNTIWVEDAKSRYLEARDEGRLSNHEGFWSWYNWSPKAKVNERIFTNSNMNQMVNVACRLYEATKEKRFLDDALLVWNGDKKLPGLENIFYQGKGVWKGQPGLAAFGKQLPWEGTEYCSVAAALYRVTKDEKYKKIIVATVKRIMDPKTGWVDPVHFYQIHMDGNGAFVHYLMDAYETAPEELADIPEKVGKMLEHVWTNNEGRATVTLHRTSDHAIRNGWNPHGGEDGYGVDGVGTSHAQSQAVRAFGVYASVMKRMKKN